MVHAIKPTEVGPCLRAVRSGSWKKDPRFQQGDRDVADMPLPWASRALFRAIHNLSGRKDGYLQKARYPTVKVYRYQPGRRMTELWHTDSADFVFYGVLQHPKVGGVFELAGEGEIVQSPGEVILIPYGEKRRIIGPEEGDWITFNVQFVDERNEAVQTVLRP